MMILLIANSRNRSTALLESRCVQSGIMDNTIINYFTRRLFLLLLLLLFAFSSGRVKNPSDKSSRDCRILNICGRTIC